MENKRVVSTSLGPKPGRVEPVAAISKARAAILARLRHSAGTLSVEELAAETGQHANTLREHLEALVTDGLATKNAAPSEGRGRPAWLYSAVAAPAGPVGYAALAAALAQHIALNSKDPQADGEAAGRAWAQTLPASSHSPGNSGGKAARTRVVKALEQAGFGVQGNRDASELTLTTCPIVEAARENSEVVCAVHRGLAKELLAGSGLPEKGVNLLPFAGPGYCTLLLPGGTGAPAPDTQ